MAWAIGSIIKKICVGFFGDLFSLEIFQHRVTPKKHSCPFQNSCGQPLSKKEIEKNTSKTRYRCDLSWRIQFLCQNWGEKPGMLSIWAFLGTTFHRHFQHRVTLQKILVRSKTLSAPFFKKEVKKSLTRPLILKSITTVSRLLQMSNIAVCVPCKKIEPHTKIVPLAPSSRAPEGCPNVGWLRWHPKCLQLWTPIIFLIENS